MQGAQNPRNPHNHKVAPVLKSPVRLASHLFLHPLYLSGIKKRPAPLFHQFFVFEAFRLLIAETPLLVLLIFGVAALKEIDL